MGSKKTRNVLNRETYQLRWTIKSFWMPSVLPNRVKALKDKLGARPPLSGFRHPGNTQKKPSGFFGLNPLKNTLQKTHTKLNSVSVCHASNN